AVTHQLHDISGPIQDSLAMGTPFKVHFHACAQLRVDLPVEKIGDLSPNLQAADFDHTHWIPYDPFSFVSLKKPTMAGPFRTRRCRCSSYHRCPEPRHRASEIWRATAAS